MNGLQIGRATTNAQGVAALNGVGLASANTGAQTDVVTAQFAGNVNFGPTRPQVP